MNSSIDHEPLREFVRQHKVTWGAQPLTAMNGPERVQVGHELELRAHHDADGVHSSMECSNCAELYLQLKKLAETALPCPDQSTRVEIGPFDGSLRLDPSEGLQPRVVLRIQILHSDDYFQPIDDCQNRCLKEIEDRLAVFGVQHGHWHNRHN